jgi:hypothetical protein
VGASQRAIGPESDGPLTAGAERSPISDIGRSHLFARDLPGQLAVGRCRLGG